MPFWKKKPAAADIEDDISVEATPTTNFGSKRIIEDDHIPAGYRYAPEQRAKRMDTLLQMYKVGFGPSSSHTMGPKKAAEEFMKQLTKKHPDADPATLRYTATLYGSLALTGKGHLTDAAIMAVFGSDRTTIRWERDKNLPFHTNGLHFVCTRSADGPNSISGGAEVLLEAVFYSIGGGAIVQRDASDLRRVASISTGAPGQGEAGAADVPLGPDAATVAVADAPGDATGNAADVRAIVRTDVDHEAEGAPAGAGAAPSPYADYNSFNQVRRHCEKTQQTLDQFVYTHEAAAGYDVEEHIRYCWGVMKGAVKAGLAKTHPVEASGSLRYPRKAHLYYKKALAINIAKLQKFATKNYHGKRTQGTPTGTPAPPALPAGAGDASNETLSDRASRRSSTTSATLSQRSAGSRTSTSSAALSVLNDARALRLVDLRKKNLIQAYALAVSEENGSATGNVVTAPTCGACGILPGLMYYYYKEYNLPERIVVNALAVGGLIGNIAKCYATISGAEGGCQAEVGVATSMAAAAGVYVLMYIDGELDALLKDPALHINAAGPTGPAGGEVEAEADGRGAARFAKANRRLLDNIEAAASIAMEHNLGLTCDPVRGLVVVPCIERNGVNALRADDCAEMAVQHFPDKLISWDEVVYTMYQTGRNLKFEYRETAGGGLARFYCLDDIADGAVVAPDAAE